MSVLVACLLSGVGVSACDSESESESESVEVVDPVIDSVIDSVIDPVVEPLDVADDTGFDDEVDCSEDALTGGDEGFRFTSAHVVVDGELGAVCFGEEDQVIVDAWDSLAAITPPAQLGDLVLFAGFEPDGDAEADTLAFVNSVDADGSGFQMSINTVDALADPDELLLTLAHEFTHVFTATSAQLDRTDEAIDTCETYFNGEGCYRSTSLVSAWIDEFWTGPLLDSVDPLGDDADGDDGADARCADDEGFFGPYAATNPEEDFAEAFSAFVFELEPATDGQADRLDWIADQPGLQEFRDRAVAAGLTPLENNFEVCGF
jgi:hypothetical protein